MHIMKLPIASDHAGFQAKEKVKTILSELGVEVEDLGTFNEDSVDYPDYGKKVAQAVSEGSSEKGVLVCGSGQGMCMTANKFRNVRAALVWNADLARLSVEHNNANILCLPGRFLSDEELRGIVQAWHHAKFEGGRHQKRVQKIDSISGS